VEPYRVLVIEDDLDSAHFVRAVLENRLGCIVGIASRVTDVDEQMSALRPDVVITDIQMPVASGLDLIEGIRDVQPGIPVIVMTAYASVDYAVQALRFGANEFLTKPVNTADLVGQVTRLAEVYRLSLVAAADRRQTVLAIGVHPDDVPTGVGGILSAHRALDDEVTILTLSPGRGDGTAAGAWDRCHGAASVIGATAVFEGHAANEPMSPVIARVVADVAPTIVYVHSLHDQRQDHRSAHEATVSVTEHVRTVACYEGGTGAISFSPTRFVPVDAVIQQKLDMMHWLHTPEKDHARYLDPDVVLATALYWSRFGPGERCEPLEIIRESTLSPSAWTHSARRTVLSAEG